MGCCQSRIKEVGKETADSNHQIGILGEEEKMIDNIQPESSTPTPNSNQQIDQPPCEKPLLFNENTEVKPARRIGNKKLEKSLDSPNTREKASVSIDKISENPLSSPSNPKEIPSVSFNIPGEKSLISLDLGKDVSKPKTIVAVSRN